MRDDWCGTYCLNDDKTYSKCDTNEWSKNREELKKNDKKHVGLDFVDGKRISTTWLGIDHQFRDGPPLLFETMVFDDGSWNDIYCKRYTTWKEAEEGHKATVQWVKDGYKDDVD